MWKIKQIFDGEYGCEERMPNEEPKLLVILQNELGEERTERVTDSWLTERKLDEGSLWPDGDVHRGRYNEPSPDGIDIYGVVEKAKEHIRRITLN